MTAGPPRWSDDEKVSAFVGKILDEAEAEAEWRFAMLPWDTVPGIPASGIFEAIERDAIAAAEEGNFRPLANLIDPNSVQKHFIETIGRGQLRIGPRAEALIASRLRGERRVKKGRGPPKKPIERRAAPSKSYYAAAELPRIEKLLRQHYPREKGIKARAISIAAGRGGIEHGTLDNYLEKQRKKNRRRVRP